MDEGPPVRDHHSVAALTLQKPASVWLPWAVVGVLVLIYPCTLYLGFGVQGSRQPILQFGWWEAFAPVFAVEFGIVGALIIRRHPQHSVGWLALAGALCTSISVLAGVYAGYSMTHSHELPATWLALWARASLWYPGLALLFVLLPAVFPDGALLSRRWQPIVWAVSAGCAAQLMLASITQAMFGFPRSDGPYPRLGWLLEPLSPLAGVLFLAPLIAVAGSVVFRYRRSNVAIRQQMKWFLATILLQASIWIVAQATTNVAEVARLFDVLVPAALILVPLSIGIGILRHQLYDVDLVISRGLAYAGLVVFITAAYLVVVVGIGLALGTGGRPNLPLSVIAMGLVVLLIQPIRARLDRLANRLVYGVAADPYTVLAELSKTPAAGDVDLALSEIARAVATGMASPRARVRLLMPGGQSRTAAWPAAATGDFGKYFAVTYGGETVGEIDADGAGDRRLTEALTAHTGHALHTLRLSAELDERLLQLEAQAAELTASRTRLVQAEESERRRLERDLHDGVQQDLVVLIAKTRLARNQLVRDPGLAAQTLAELQGSAQHALADLRSLARGIHPAVLGSRGLVEAVRAMAARMPIGVRIDAEQSVGEVRYAPEIEGAAYFVVAEGLANVLKHSGSTQARVTFSATDSCLMVAVADDGRGFDAETVRESGLRGLRDRVEALGGHLDLCSREPGTRLEVSLPATRRSHD